MADDLKATNQNAGSAQATTGTGTATTGTLIGGVASGTIVSPNITVSPAAPYVVPYVESFRVAQAEPIVDIGEVSDLFRTFDDAEEVGVLSEPADLPMLDSFEGDPTDPPYDLRANALSSARRPTWKGKTSASCSRPSLADLVRLAGGSASDVTTNVRALPASLRRGIASRTLLGDPAADNFRDLSLFPVVNSRGQLCEGLLRAVLGGRGAQAKVSPAALESARRMARSLLNSQFGAKLEAAAKCKTHADAAKCKTEAAKCKTRANDASDDSPDSLLSKIKQLLGLTTHDVADYSPSADGVEHRSSEEPTQETTAMADATEPTRDERIAKLVANEKTRFTAKDAEWLHELTDLAYTRIEQIAYEGIEVTPAPAAVVAAPAAATPATTVAAAAPSIGTPSMPENENEPDMGTPTDETETGCDPAMKTVHLESAATPLPSKVEATPVTERPRSVPQTAEQYIASLSQAGAPPAVVSMFSRAVAQEKEMRSACIAKIRANGANTFTEAWLNERTTEELEALGKIADAPKGPAFVGRGVHTFTRPEGASATDQKLVRMPKMDIPIGGALTKSNK